MYAVIGMLAAGAWPFLTQLFVGVTIAVVAAIATVWLAHRRFRADQSWLARREAYSDVLKRLLELKTICDDLRREFSAIEVKEALLRFQMAAVINSFFFTDEARDVIEGFIDSLKAQRRAAELAKARPNYLEAQDAPVRLKALSDAAVSAMTAIHKIAKKDLGIK